MVIVFQAPNLLQMVIVFLSAKSIPYGDFHFNPKSVSNGDLLL
jgi:hypothetical protein